MTIPKSQIILFSGALILFAYFIIKHYWRARTTLFPHLIRQRVTPSSYQIAPHLRPAFEKTLARGIRESANSKILIVGMVRDVAPSINNIIEKVERIGKHFKDYKVLIVENDSVDGTRNLLFGWKRKNPRVIILGCGVDSGHESSDLASPVSLKSSDLTSSCKIPKTPKTVGHEATRPRIEKMALLRNIYLDYIKNMPDRKDYSYTAIWDLDSLSVLYEDGVLHSLGVMAKDPTTGVVCANGIYNWGFFTYYYDTYAHLEKGEVYDPSDKMAHNLRHGALESHYYRGEDPAEVDSCFAGFTIYRTEALVKSKYDLPQGNLVCEHVALHKRMSPDVKKIVNPSMINLVLLNE